VGKAIARWIHGRVCGCSVLDLCWIEDRCSGASFWRTGHVYLPERAFVFAEFPFSEEAESAHAEREDGGHMI